MPKTLSDTLVIAVSSRALFDLDESNRVYEHEGLEAYIRHQIEREREVLAPGVAYPLVEKLLALNAQNLHIPRVEVILLSRNNADTGLRVFHSVQQHRLAITRAAFTTGASPYPYAKAFGAHLFLSAHPEDVQKALGAGIAAATILPGGGQSGRPGQVRIAFDGDAVLFTDASERVYQREGLEAFRAHEAAQAEVPLERGPFAGFLHALQRIQSAFPAEDPPIRTALITARGAPSHERVVRTLRHWGVRIDESLFLDGLAKGPFLRAFGADIFFDDQQQHLESARPFVTAAHVPGGVADD